MRSKKKFEENWERMKIYLIRSLFQEYRDLSTVPEHDESSNDGIIQSARSGDLADSRPHSPLPPLVIERMPNRHDHPEEFYTDLERKMKKLYKKLFLDARSSSIDDLETYRDNLDVQSLIDEEYHTHRAEVEYADIAPFDNVQNHATLKKYSDAVDISSVKDVNVNSSQSPKENMANVNFVESSTQSLSATQVTIVADVHTEPVQHHSKTRIDEMDTVVLSPILESRRKVIIDKNVSKSEQNDNKSVLSEHAQFEENDGSSSKEAETTENEYIAISQARDQISNNSSSDTSVEQMRRQRQISSSLGSLPNDIMDTNSSGFSVTYTDIDFQKKMSPDKSIQSESSKKEISGMSGIILNDFSSISAPSFCVESRERFSKEADRRRKSSNSSETTPELIAKKKRYENNAVQTLITSNCENVDWNLLNNNFFVGVPKIYKLCCCSDHSCPNKC